VTNKSYQEIVSKDVSRALLTENLSMNLTNRVQARTKEVTADA
jgi:hypothetical protein